MDKRKEKHSHIRVIKAYCVEKENTMKTTNWMRRQMFENKKTKKKN
jgi:hypothetical protein